MKKLAFVFALLFVAGIATAEDYPILSAGGGGFTPLDGERTVCWEDPPNLDGLIGSSEQILSQGLESEIANDYIVEGCDPCHVTWWAGYYNYVPGDPLLTTYVLRHYDDGGCVPLSMLVETIIPDNAGETFIYDQAGFPVYEYQHTYDALGLSDGLYWFGAQAGDHPFPPQHGRLAAEFIQACDSVFKSAFFAFPDWLPAIDVFGAPCDASQRFDDECDPTATEEATWGSINSLY